jgi:hypothetical protein
VSQGSQTPCAPWNPRGHAVHSPSTIPQYPPHHSLHEAIAAELFATLRLLCAGCWCLFWLGVTETNSHDHWHFNRATLTRIAQRLWTPQSSLWPPQTATRRLQLAEHRKPRGQPSLVCFSQLAACHSQLLMLRDPVGTLELSAGVSRFLSNTALSVSGSIASFAFGWHQLYQRATVSISLAIPCRIWLARALSGTTPHDASPNECIRHGIYCIAASCFVERLCRLGGPRFFEISDSHESR